MKVGLIGYGTVGSQMAELFDIEHIWDPDKYKKDDLSDCDFVFICVPTPVTHLGNLDTSMVEDALEHVPSSAIAIIKSTVNPGFCEEFALRKKVVYAPEFLGETPSHPYAGRQPEWVILGGSAANCQRVISLYWTKFNANLPIRRLTHREAEVAKLSENRAIMWKVLQCQELYDACLSDHVDYYRIRDAVYGDDPRFDLWFSAVYPESRGCDSPCIPKDVIAWAKWAKWPDATTRLLDYNEDLIKKNAKSDSGL